MMMITNLWEDGGVWKNIICYIMDITTIVTFFEAMNILIVENKEKAKLGQIFKKI